MVPDDIIAKKHNEGNPIVELDVDKLQLLSQNPKIKSLVKQIMEKLARQKKYKKNSIEMLGELKNELIEILNKQKKNENNEHIC